MARLDFLSYSTTAGMTVQLLCMLGTCAIFGSLQVAKGCTRVKHAEELNSHAS